MVRNNKFSTPGRGLVVNAANYTPTVTGNDFSGAAIKIERSGGTTTVDATCNWWGTTAGHLIASGGATYEPWSVSSTECSLATHSARSPTSRRVGT